MDRKQAFENLQHHPWFGKVFARLKPATKALALQFIEQHQSASHDQFIPLVNRMFLDKERPKQWELILDLLTAASVAANQKTNILSKDSN